MDSNKLGLSKIGPLEPKIQKNESKIESWWLSHSVIDDSIITQSLGIIKSFPTNCSAEAELDTNDWKEEKKQERKINK